jgi:nitrogen regulatory protein PII
LKKITKIIRMFKKSPTKNSLLQENVQKKEKKQMKLLLDVKTRWNSMITMIKRFIQIADCVNKTLRAMNLETVSNEELTT